MALGLVQGYDALTKERAKESDQSADRCHSQGMKQENNSNETS